MMPLLRAMSVGILVSVYSFGCDGRTVVSGRVQDSDGKGVDGARVRLGRRVESGSLISPGVRTSGGGRYRVSRTHAPGKVRLQLKVSKTGYETHREEIGGGQKIREKNITLKKKSVKKK